MHRPFTGLALAAGFLFPVISTTHAVAGLPTEPPGLTDRSATLGETSGQTAVRGRETRAQQTVISPALGAEQDTPRPVKLDSPLSPAESLEHFQLYPAVKIELVAAEPQVVDPVAIAFDEDTRLWVAEMSDYPNGPSAGEPPRSRIRLLEDRDGDGRYERSTVFADRLLFANGVQPWKRGVIVTLAGEVAWFADDDGDGRADRKETWFTGFAQENPQLRANHPTFALDNHIYVANGLRGGKVIAAKKEWTAGAEPVDIGGRDFRFDPLSGRYEAVSGFGQFGLTFDDFGNRFVCSNRNPCKHVVLEDRYLKRNRFLAVAGVEHDVSPAGEESHIFPISQAWTTSTLHAGQFTAACGVTIYRGDLLPNEFRGNSFTCDPTGNLVHRDVLEPQGATFRSRPGREGIEFLATPDEWFRAVNLAHGPDGALYVVDMYRAVIEHPQFVPEELKDRPDLYHGDDRGRIYRIVPAESSAMAQRRTTPVKLSSATSAELVGLLDHANSWQRETAARLLYERQDRSVRKELESLASDGKTPAGRVQALQTLAGLQLLSTEVVGRALDDPHPRVREQAVVLPEGWYEKDRALLAKVLKQAGQADERLRFQTALSLGDAAPNEPGVRRALAGLVLRGAADPWTRTAVATCLEEDAVEFLKLLLEPLSAAGDWGRPGMAELVSSTAEIVGAQPDDGAAQEALAALAGAKLPTGDSEQAAARMALLRVQMAGFDGLGRGLRRRRQTLSALVEQLAVRGDATHAEVENVFRQAIRQAGDRDAEAGLRVQAVSLLKHAAPEWADSPLKELVRGEPNQTVRLAAIETLAVFRDPAIADTLLADFAAQTPAVRRALLDAMLSDVDRTRRLLAEIEAGRMQINELDPTRVERLRRHRDTEIRAHAAKLLAAAVPEDRKKVLAEYQAALTLPADPERGRLVFTKNCTACHRIGNLGVNVAPDIADSRTKTPDYLLVAIVDPNRAVDSNYFSYTVVTTDGKVHTGLVASQTANSVTLRQQEGKTVTVLVDEIEEMRSNGISLMPVGVEKNVSVQEMSDLISFIKNWRYLGGRVPIDVGK